MPRLRERFVIDENGEKTEVLLSVEDYRRLLEVCTIWLWLRSAEGKRP